MSLRRWTSRWTSSSDVFDGSLYFRLQHPPATWIFMSTAVWTSHLAFITVFTTALPYPYPEPNDPVHIIQFDLLKIHFHIILPSMLTSTCPLFPSFQPTKHVMHFSSPSTCHMLHPSYLPLYDQPSNIWPGMQDSQFLITQFSPCFSYVFLLRPKSAAYSRTQLAYSFP